MSFLVWLGNVVVVVVILATIAIVGHAIIMHFSGREL